MSHNLAIKTTFGKRAFFMCYSILGRFLIMFRLSFVGLLLMFKGTLLGRNSQYQTFYFEVSKGNFGILVKRMPRNVTIKTKKYRVTRLRKLRNTIGYKLILWLLLLLFTLRRAVYCGSNGTRSFHGSNRLLSPSKVGSWMEGSARAKETTAKGIPHETVLDEKVFAGTAKQSNNTLTTKVNCYKKDPSVTETTCVSPKLMKTGKNQNQYLAWKDKGSQITKKDLPFFKVRRPTTAEEDAHFQASLKLKGNPNFRTSGLKAKDRYNNIEPNDKDNA